MLTRRDFISTTAALTVLNERRVANTYRLGRELNWDPVAEKFTADEEANKHLLREPRAEWLV